MKTRTTALALVPLAVLAVALWSRPTPAQEKPVPPVAKWEYEVLVEPPEKGRLNKFGDEGWELAGTTTRANSPFPYLIFKRPKR